MKSEEALSIALDEAKKQGCDSCDVLVGESNSLGVEIFETRPKNIEYSTSRGLGVRVFKEGRPGYAFTEKYSRESIAQTVKDALSHSAMTGPLPLELPSQPTLPEIDLQEWHPQLENLTTNQLIKKGLEMESMAMEAHPDVENIPYLGLSRSSGQSWLANTSGVYLSQKSNGVYGGLGVVAKSGDVKKMGVYSNQVSDLKEIVPSFYAHRAVARAIELLHPKPIQAGKLPVVLSHRISGKLLSMYSSVFYAESVQKGQSRLKDKLQSAVATPQFSLTCDPHLPNTPGSRLFDGEGVATQLTSVIDKGILQTYLYNLETAKKEGRNSTGHASRGYSGSVGTSFSNFRVHLGNRTIHELLSAHSKCLYIVSLEGGSGCSAVSGEVSIGVQGFYVEQGQIKHAVEGITMSGNFFDILQSIEGIGNQYNDQHSSVRVPDLLIKSLDFAS